MNFVALYLFGISHLVSSLGTFYQQLSDDGSNEVKTDVNTKGFHRCSIKSNCKYVGKPVGKADKKVYLAENIAELRKKEKKLQIWQKMEAHDLKANVSFSATSRGFKSCAEAKQAGKRKSGTIKLEVTNGFMMDAYCDMEKAGGGWIVFQRRLNDSVSFERPWHSYENGFGTLNGSFWMGLKTLHHLTSRGKWKLRVDLKGSMLGAYAVPGYAEYTNFSIASATEKYKLMAGKYSGDIGDALAQSIGMYFSTEDEDNDLAYECDQSIPSNCEFSCAWVYKGAWWHNDCFDCNLNSWYPGTQVSQTEPKNKDMMTWKTWSYEFGNIYFSEMKIKME